MNIEKAALADIPVLVNFQQQMASETEDLKLNEDILTAGIRQLFADPGKGQYIVVRDQEQAVGCLMITYEWSDWRNGTVIWIQSVYVLPEYRKQGIFRRLYSHIKEMVDTDPQYCGIRLYVEKENHRAQRVYEAMGMNKDHYQLYEWMK